MKTERGLLRCLMTPSLHNRLRGQLESVMANQLLVHHLHLRSLLRNLLTTCLEDMMSPHFAVMNAAPNNPCQMVRSNATLASDGLAPSTMAETRQHVSLGYVIAAILETSARKMRVLLVVRQRLPLLHLNRRRMWLTFEILRTSTMSWSMSTSVSLPR